MKVCILYHPKSDHARKVEQFVRDLKRAENKTTELLSLETREGASMASLYDITKYPAILTLRDNGELLKHWEGEELPLFSEVSAYSG